MIIDTKFYLHVYLRLIQIILFITIWTDSGLDF